MGGLREFDHSIENKDDQKEGRPEREVVESLAAEEEKAIAKFVWDKADFV